MKKAERLYTSVLKNSRQENDLFFNSNVEMTLTQQQLVMKQKEKSEKARKKGNNLFVKKPHSAEEHKAIIKLYNKSIAHALPGSEELAFAYGNRSALFLHLNEYKESIADTERALRITCSNSFKVKLFRRKAQALKELGSNEGQHVLDKAKHFIKKISENDTVKKTLSEMIAKTETMLKTVETVKTVSSLPEERFLKERLKMLQINEEKSIFESVTVNYSEKYGRFLIANRDFRPGEIIFTEQFYATSLNSRKKYSHCDNCLKPCWMLMPCNYCNWAMYCSEKCKSEAYENHHYVECTLISFINANETMIIEGRLPIRLLLMAIKEAGSIENLKAHVKKIDNETDASHTEFFREKNFERKFTAAYRLKSFMKLSADDDPVIVALSIMLLKVLYRGEIKIDSIEDMLKNKDVIFIGSLFMKFFKMKLANCYSVQRTIDVCNHANATDPIHLQNYCQETGSGLCLISSLVNHSCIPNISRTSADNKSIIFFAIQPIKAGSPLFDSYQASFYQESKAKRHEPLKKLYQFICDCDACKNNWPNYSMKELHIAMHKYLEKIDSSGNLSSRMLEIEKFIQENKNKHNTDSQCQQYPQIIKDISNCMEKVFEKCPLNSKTACNLYYLLHMAYSNLYDMRQFNYLKCS